jgi:uncharacterized protein
MMAFLDTSSLIKLYHQEIDSDIIIEALATNDIEMILLSELAMLEFCSALWKKVREKVISKQSATEVIQCFNRDRNNYKWISLQYDIVISASKLLMKYGCHGLRTLDSLQLASAITMKNTDCIFLTSDKLLHKFFIEEELYVL